LATVVHVPDKAENIAEIRWTNMDVNFRCGAILREIDALRVQQALLVGPSQGKCDSRCGLAKAKKVTQTVSNVEEIGIIWP
jgi:hypothetical protein